MRAFTTLSPDLHQSAPHALQGGRKTRRMNLNRETIARIALLAVLVAVVAGCGGGREGADEGNGTTTAAGGDSDLSGRIQADGSSTVGPYTTAAAERFQRENSGVQVTVGVSGTGGGFERFCRGETDLSNASRPIKDEEAQICESAGIEPVEFQVANDALTIVVNTANDWVTCLTVEQLKTIWGPGSKVSNWNQVDPAFPDQELSLFGPGTDSGTFDYFTDEINGEEGASRSDYSASEDDNTIVTGVSGEKGGLGYFGFSYFEENQDALKAVEVDGGDGCVAPSVENAQNGTYKPLSRPLFVYAKKEALQKPEVAAFLQYMLDNETAIAEQAQFVPLTEEQLTKARTDLEAATG
jgi:phosphate transport system substrate-binding protein